MKRQVQGQGQQVNQNKQLQYQQNRQNIKSPYGKSKASKQGPRPGKLTPQSQQNRQNNINNNRQAQNSNRQNANQQRNNNNQQQDFQNINQNQVNQQPIQNQEMNLAYEAINNLIHEYLLKNGMQKTLDLFQDEIFEPSKIGSLETSYEQQLQDAFDAGKKDEFFSKWIKFIPVSIRFKDDRANKLEFYLQVYFLIFNIHPLNKKAQQISQQDIEFFKEYLDTRGSELAKTSEFLQFYALPYIIKPAEHPALKHIFTIQWINDLKGQLTDFLQNLYPNEQVPLLFHVYTQYIKINNQSNSTLGLGDINKQLGAAGLAVTGGAGGDEVDFNYSITQTQGIQNPLEPNSKDLNQYKEYIQKLENNNKELLNVIQEFNFKYNNLQKNYRQFAEQAKQNLMESQSKWFQVAQDLVLISNDLLKMVESSNKGIPIQENILVKIVDKLGKYEKFLNANLEDLITQSQDMSLFDKTPNSGNNNNAYNYNNQKQGNGGQLDYSLASPIQPMQQVMDTDQNFEENQQIYNYVQIDFEKIKELFVQEEQNPQLICLVLQALRWRITKTRGAYVRREIVLSYATFDILGFKDEKQQIQEKLLVQGDDKVKELTLRLINAMASDFYGRSYLVESEHLAITLINILKSENNDSFNRKNALGALQKFSLRRKPQITMIENDLIHWIVTTLKEEKDTLSEYSYEYATALFMNLSLRNLGKTKCQDPNEEVLIILNDLLEHENVQVKTFVNGTLYSLLSRHSLREQAKAMGMNEILKYLMENSDERFTKQLQYIMDQLNRQDDDEDDEDAVSDTPEEDNDIDDIEEEEDIGEDDDKDDQIDNFTEGMQVGEDLIQQQFALQGQQSQEQEEMMKNIFSEQQIKRSQQTSQIIQSQNQRLSDVPFNRPTTPNLSVSQISQNQYQQQQQHQQQGYNHNQQLLQQQQFQQSSQLLNQQTYNNQDNNLQNQQPFQNNSSNIIQNQSQKQNQNNLKQQQQILEQEQYASMQKQATQNQLVKNTQQNQGQTSDQFIKQDDTQNENQNPEFQENQENNQQQQQQQQQQEEIPIELQSRPKIARTPLDGTRKNKIINNNSSTINQSQVSQQNQQINNNSSQQQSIDNQKQAQPEENPEFQQAFQSKPKIVRTPPGNENPRNQLKNESNRYY